MLHLFPDRMLDGSIHTAVLVGILLLWFLTERWGWVFAGFVVPGYLAALGIVAPASLAAITVEAILTYGVVWALGAGASELGLWSRVFGRERFLLFVVISVPVRLVVEGLGAPQAELLIGQLWDVPAWQGQRFFGIGVVLVPLLANAWWKLGLGRGLLQVGVVTGLTWAVLALLLIPYTNFQFGGFEQTFEDVALDFLASPKIYIVLVTAAFFGARNNLLYGWDFGGIMVPALLALVALTPTELVVTLLEAVVLAAFYVVVVQLPGIRSLNLEGPRRLVSMYLLSYALKWILAMAAQALDIQFYVSDLYGFGYLLTSLIAVRCVKGGRWGRTLLPLLYTTGQGLLAGLVISLVLAWALTGKGGDRADAADGWRELPMARSVLQSHSSIRQSAPARKPARTALDARLRSLRRLASASGTTDPRRVVEDAVDTDREWALRADGRRCLALSSPRRGSSPPDGAPAIWWCGGTGPGLVVPRPVGDPDAFLLGAWLMAEADFSFLVVAGVDLAATEPAAIRNSARTDASGWRSLRRALGDRPVLVLTTHAGATSRLDPVGGRALDVHTEALPAGLAVELEFEEQHGALQPLWEQLEAGDALLTLSQDRAWEALFARHGADPGTPTSAGDPPPAAPPGWVPDARSPHAQDDLIAIPPVVLARTMGWAAEGALHRRPAAAWIAEQLGLRLTLREDPLGQTLWEIDLDEGGPTGWGRWTLRVGPSRAMVVAAPVSSEEPGTAEIARRWFDERGASALWISDHGSRFGHGDPLRLSPDRLDLEPLALREALRSLDAEPDPTGLLLLVVRRQGAGGAATAGLVMATAEEAVDGQRAQRLRARLAPLTAPWPGADLLNGGLASAGLQVSGQAPVRYLEAVSPDRAAVAWFAPEILGEVRGTPDHAARTAWYRELGVPVWELADPARDPRLQAVDPARSLDPAPPADALRRHAETRSEDALEELRAGEPGQVVVLDTGLRLIPAWIGPERLCTAAAGAPTDDAVFPWTGCWGAP
jgi:hypothetical protein